jgi:hypothetical protein
LLSELHAVGGLQTRSVDDVQAMLSVERQKDLLACDSSTCMVELAGALGTDLVLYGSLGKLGSQLSWSVSVLDPRNGHVAARASITALWNETDVAAQARALVPTIVRELNEYVGGEPR